jgi:plastocyanin
MTTRFVSPVFVAVCVALAACGGSSSDTAQPAATSAPAAAAPAAAPADGATVSGKITFEGTPPAPTPVKLSGDPYCEKSNPGMTTEAAVVGANGALANVFVYVKDGLGNQVYPAPATPVVLDQKGCHYTPHVIGIQVGQALQIVNSDDTLHNVHGLAKTNKEFNQGQPIQGMKMTHVFSAREVMVPFKCDVHGWMNAWVGVLDHPFYAVSTADGAFSLKGLPAGTYTIEAWHERFGTQTQTVTIGEKESKEIAFTFKAA